MVEGWFYAGSESAAARNASTQANHAASDARGAKQTAEALEDRVERLALMTEALWTLLRDRVGLTEEELMAVAREIDLQDGKLDGKVQRASSACGHCGRMVGRRHVKCLYCGTPMPRAPFTDV